MRQTKDLVYDVDKGISMIIQSIKYRNPIDYASCFSEEANWLLLDSQGKQPQSLSRYSFIAVLPFMHIRYDTQGLWIDGRRVEGTDPVASLQTIHRQYRLKTYPGLPPFQGGIAGLWCYHWAYARYDITSEPMEGIYWLLACYDVVISFDHLHQRAWIVSNGLPEKGVLSRERHAKKRMGAVLERIQNVRAQPCTKKRGGDVRALSSNFSAETYQEVVRQAIQQIREGEVFEVNLSQRFHYSMPLPFSTWHLFQRLRTMNPAPFSAYLRDHDVTIVSASPERFLSVSDAGFVETRPIKGTCKRSDHPEEDARLADALLRSEKDRAENTMIVDLMRHDLSRLCTPKSVVVPKYCGLESYAGVHHLVSVVQGQLRTHYDAMDLLRDSFPGGSISGAPKLRAMQIIHALENVSRGPYCGSIGYWGWNGCMDTSILIRSFVIEKGQLSFHVGGAVVLDSDPLTEYQETLIKAHLLRQALLA